MIQPIKARGPSPRLCDEPPEPSHSSHKNALNETRRPQPAGTKSHAAVTATPNASRARRPRATTSTIHPPLPLAPTKLRPRYLPETKFSRDGPSQVGSVHTPRFPFRRVYARQRGGRPKSHLRKFGASSPGREGEKGTWPFLLCSRGIATNGAGFWATLFFSLFVHLSVECKTVG
jgi:hypothetical protein